jgi:hypothetical protein
MYREIVSLESKSKFGEKYGLPEPICGHNQYFLWGPGNYTGKSMILVSGNSKTNLQKTFKSVKLMDRTQNDYCMPYEDHLPIWLCEDPNKPLKEIWPNVKNYN